MPRERRAVAPGFPHHLVQRGNNRQIIFHEKVDKTQYLHLLDAYSSKSLASTLAYCVMDNHIHILAKPQNEHSLSDMMHVLGQCYAQYFNKKYGRTGTLWEGRYYSCIVEDDLHLWAVARYIEQNPRRAGMVEKDEDYAFSSARAHILGVPDSLLREPIFDERERGYYVKLVRERISEEAAKGIRDATSAGKLFGSESFRAKIEQALKQSLVLFPKGRPRKRGQAPFPNC